MSKLEPSLAFLFPGQGSQSVGMLSELASEHSEVKAVFDEASGVLGYDLWALVASGTADDLNLTEKTQPAMLAAGVACYRVWEKLSNIRPAWMAGHSLGEYTALVCSGSLAFPDAVRLVKERGTLMQQAVAPGAGAMAAILGLDDSAISSICASISSDEKVVSPANFNAPGQVVIAGHAAAVSAAVDAAKVNGAKRAVLLPVSVPSHCLLMASIAVGFRSLLEATRFESPSIRVIHNVDCSSQEQPSAIRHLLERQLFCSVRWADCVRTLSSQNVSKFVECGPGKVLLGLNKRIVGEATTEAIFDSLSLNRSLQLVA